MFILFASGPSAPHPPERLEKRPACGDSPAAESLFTMQLTESRDNVRQRIRSACYAHIQLRLWKLYGKNLKSEYSSPSNAGVSAQAEFPWKKRVSGLRVSQVACIKSTINCYAMKCSSKKECRWSNGEYKEVPRPRTRAFNKPKKKRQERRHTYAAVF